MVVRARIIWLQDGEKPTKYFCGLENHKYLEKTVKKICLQDDSLITNQHEILSETKRFYSSLFSNHDDKLQLHKLDNILNNLGATKLSVCESIIFRR